MIQRKQSLFMLLSVFMMVACLSLPIGYFRPNGMGLDKVIYNLYVTGMTKDGSLDFTICPMFIILVTAAAITLLNIFAYRNRSLQAKLCLVSAFMEVAWYVVGIVYNQNLCPEDCTFVPHWSDSFPFVSLILLLMSRRAILADERLVRAADRIR